MTVVGGLIIGNKLNVPTVNLVTDTATANKIVYARLITPGSDMTTLKKKKGPPRAILLTHVTIYELKMG